MSVWITVIGVGVGSYLFRVSMLVVAARGGLPPLIARSAHYAAPVAFAALATTALAAGAHAGLATVPPAAAVGVAIIASRRTGSPHAAIVAGMPTLWILSALLPT